MNCGTIMMITGGIITMMITGGIITMNPLVPTIILGTPTITTKSDIYHSLFSLYVVVL
jgi:hypothetical protein